MRSGGDAVRCGGDAGSGHVQNKQTSAVGRKFKQNQ